MENFNLMKAISFNKKFRQKMQNLENTLRSGKFPAREKS